MYGWTLLITCTAMTTWAGKITEIEQHSGLIFQELGTVTRYQDTWRIIYYLPVYETQKNIRALTRNVDKMENIRSAMRERDKIKNDPEQADEMRPIIDLMIKDMHELAKLVYDNNKILFPETGGRRKRSVMMTVEAAIDYLFNDIGEKTFNETKAILNSAKEGWMEFMATQTIVTPDSIQRLSEGTKLIGDEMGGIWNRTWELAKDKISGGKETKSRRKRSLPMVGSAIEFLFGNIDESSFNKMQYELSNAKEKQENVVDIMVNQTIMSRGMIQLVKNNTVKVEQELNRVLDRMDVVTSTWDTEQNKRKFGDDILALDLREYRRLQNGIFGALSKKKPTVVDLELIPLTEI